MKNVKSLSSFSNVSIQKSEMKKVVGGFRNCPARQPWQYGCPELL
jgi:natural product precursor